MERRRLRWGVSAGDAGGVLDAACASGTFGTLAASGRLSSNREKLLSICAAGSSTAPGILRGG
jgi:hypothetical protein